MAVGMTTIAGGACYGAPLVVVVAAAAVPIGAALWFIGPPRRRGPATPSRCRRVRAWPRASRR
ncbi:hypothetical protein ACFQZ4_30790 [Catellatospora coxensis]